MPSALDDVTPTYWPALWTTAPSARVAPKASSNLAKIASRVAGWLTSPPTHSTAQP